MRVTFNSFPDTLLGRLQSLGTEQNKALTQLSTGQRLAAPSDDAPAMQRILNLRTEKKQNQQFYRNGTDGLEKSKVTFSSLEQIKDLVVRASELSANISGATSEQEYKAKASEINQLIEQGLNVANTKLRGNYLFSGDSNSKIPFEENRSLDGKITSVSYNGSSSESKIHIGEGESASITVGSMADENRAVADTLSKLIELRNAMSAAPSATKTQSILDLRAKVPVKMPATSLVGSTINFPSGFDVGNQVTFTLTSGKGAPLENGKTYFVVDLGSGKKGISATDGGAAITLTQEIDDASKVSRTGVSPTSLPVSKTGSTINLPTNILVGDTITFDFTAGKGMPLQSGQRYYVVDLGSGNKGVSMTPGGPAISLTQEIDTASTVSKVRLDTVEDTILSALSRAGTIQYRLETAMKDLEVRYEGTEKLISTDADIDFAEATVRLNRAQMAYQAAIQSGARIQSNSLLDYLR